MHTGKQSPAYFGPIPRTEFCLGVQNISCTKGRERSPSTDGRKIEIKDEIGLWEGDGRK